MCNSIKCLRKVENLENGHDYKIFESLREGVGLMEENPRFACVSFRILGEMIVSRLLKQFGIKVTGNYQSDVASLRKIGELKNKKKFFERLNVIRKNGNISAHSKTCTGSYDKLAVASFKATLKCTKKMSALIDGCYEYC